LIEYLINYPNFVYENSKIYFDFIFNPIFISFFLDNNPNK